MTAAVAMEPTEAEPSTTPATPAGRRLTPEQMAVVLANHEAMVWRIARNLRRNYPLADLDDLAAEVRLGFVYAASLFDPSKGYTFLTYAYRAGLQRGLAFLHAERFRGMHAPLACSGVQADGTTGGGVAVVSLHDKARNADPGCGRDQRSDLWGLLRDDRRPPPRIDPRFWDVVCAGLTERERQAVIGRWRDEMTYERVGAAAGISKAAVQQHETKAINKILRRSRSKLVALADLVVGGEEG